MPAPSLWIEIAKRQVILILTDLNKSRPIVLICYVLQALLVTGGWDGSDYFSSTEIYLESTSTWSYAAALPSSRYGISAATLDNSVFVFGKNNLSFCSEIFPLAALFINIIIVYIIVYSGGNTGSYSDEILSYDPTSDSWNVISNMAVSRYHYGVSLICEVSTVCPADRLKARNNNDINSLPAVNPDQNNDNNMANNPN